MNSGYSHQTVPKPGRSVAETQDHTIKRELDQSHYDERCGDRTTNQSGQHGEREEKPCRKVGPVASPGGRCRDECARKCDQDPQAPVRSMANTLSQSANVSAHRWRPLRDCRIAERRCGAAIRCSAWLNEAATRRGRGGGSAMVWHWVDGCLCVSAFARQSLDRGPANAPALRSKRSTIQLTTPCI